jgi:hypothetical protein
MKFISFVVLFYSFGSFAGSIHKSDNPRLMVKNLVISFDLLPQKGIIKNKQRVWPASHWQNYLGNISYRWSAASNKSFSYSIYNRSKILALEPHEIDVLSPAEKLDLLRGNYSFPTTRKLIRKHSPNNPTWHGICHGMAVAALHHDEPRPITLENADGVEIEFYSSDIKGLLSYFYAYIAKAPYKQVGKRCYKENSKKLACQGLNPASFHTILANLNGLNGESFVVDIDRGSEVWNHVIESYSSYIVNEAPIDSTSAPEAVKRIRVQTAVEYAGVIVPKFDPVIGTDNESYFQQNYDYYLEIDKNGEIVGGEWISNIRPDFIWHKGKSKFAKEWSFLNQLVQ